ncbi:hypothetical protein [Bacillus sp. FSL L8-0654]|uniref:hypothetical protein n=1 Tax=Bacillus sp. FSL L8-0654 TaxID=2921526 RepID=UPI00315AC7B0
MDALIYENFVRGAFGYVLNEDKKMLDRSGDPARLADAGYFRTAKLNELKAAVTYSMSIYNFQIREYHEPTEDDYGLTSYFVQAVNDAVNPSEILDLINRYKQELKVKYL